VISLALKLELEVVRQLLANDPSQGARLTESIREESKKFRCGLSNRLMTSPVMHPDGNYYEQSSIEAHSSISSERALLNPKKKAKILEFCRKSLNELVVHLRRKDPHEKILELSAECLSVLSIETEMQNFLRELGAVGEETMTKLSDKLRRLVGEEDLITLMHRSTEELPTLALCLTKLFMLEPLSERAFEEAFRCFTELLSQDALSAGAIDLAEQVSEKLSSTQLSQMNQALKTQPREEEVELRLERLRLKEAYLRLREGDTETAVRLVNTLQNSLHLKREVLEFYEEAGMHCEKVSVLKLKLSELVGRESPSVAAVFDTFQQIFYAELQALSLEVASKQALDSLRGEVETLREDQVQVANQCKSAQSDNEATLRSIERKSQKSETAAQKVREKVEALTGKQRAQDAQIYKLDEKLNEAEAATQQKLNILREDVGALRTDLDQALSQCKQVQLAQEAMLQRLEEQSQKTEANTLKLNRVDTSHEVTLPTFLYSYNERTDQLYWTSLVTGEQSSHQVPSYIFKYGCCWSEVPGGSLLITGGGYPTASREVVRIDVATFEVSRLRDMLTPRSCHSAVYHTQHLYVLGGYSDSSSLRECERYVCAEVELGKSYLEAHGVQAPISRRCYPLF
jgi:hypothetical protein